MSQLAEAEEEDHGWEIDEEDADKDELCNCRFSLAYGGKILLNNATLRLIRGRRYGLCGGNGVGKSTLMKAIARGQLDGFPAPDELKTVYVEHDIQVGLRLSGGSKHMTNTTQHMLYLHAEWAPNPGGLVVWLMVFGIRAPGECCTHCWSVMSGYNKQSFTVSCSQVNSALSHRLVLMVWMALTKEHLPAEYLLADTCVAAALALLLQASLADHRVPDYVAEDPLIKVMGVTREQVVEALQSVGFSDDLLVSWDLVLVLTARALPVSACSASARAACLLPGVAVSWLQRWHAGELDKLAGTWCCGLTAVAYMMCLPARGLPVSACSASAGTACWLPGSAISWLQ
jgi:hypothetical protein